MANKHSITKQAALLLIVASLAALGGCQTAPVKKEKEPELAFPSPPDPPRYYFERSIISTADVQQEDEESQLKALLTGVSSKSTGTGFSKPFDIAVHQGRVFIADTVQRTVLALDFTENRSFTVGDRGDNGDLSKPLGIAVSDNGFLFVCDATEKTVNMYDRDGNYIRSIGSRDRLTRPAGIDVTTDGKTLFVVDVGGVRSDDHNIKVYDTESGEHIRTIGSRGTEDGQLNLPRDVAVGPDGNIYVTDGGNFRVQVLTPEGKFVRKWGQAGARTGNFSRPKGMAVDKQGISYAVDAAFGNVQLFNPDGQLLMFIGSRSMTPGPAKFVLPAGVDVDEDGRIYMVGQFYRKVDVFRPATLGKDEGYLGAGKKQ